MLQPFCPAKIKIKKISHMHLLVVRPASPNDASSHSFSLRLLLLGNFPCFESFDTWQAVEGR